MNASPPKIRSLRATPVNVPMARPHPTGFPVREVRLEYQDWAAPILQRRLEPKEGFAIPQQEAGCGIAREKDAVGRYRLR